MRPLSAGELLRAWEAGRRLGPVGRPLAILAAEEGDAAWDALAALPLGERNRRLLALRAATFGTGMECVTACPTCGERVELEVDATVLAGSPPAAPSPELDDGGFRLRLRPLATADLFALAGCADVESGRRALAGRAVVEAWRGEEPIAAAELPERLIGAISERLAAADPASELILALSCPSCGAEWAAELDVGDFVWREVAAAAMRALQEVHLLARSYGWSEREILSLSPARRAAYLELVGA